MDHNQKKFPFHFLRFIFSLPFLFSLLSCTSPTETPTGTLTGTVSLEGQSDFSNITVALYDLAYLDTTITRINAQYPNIGIKITQHTEFDHRLQSPVKSTETLADGSFELTKISTGTYNLVAMKAGFGFKYLYEITIDEGDNELSELTELTPRSPLLKTIEGKKKSNRLSEEISQGHSTKSLPNNNPVISTSVEKSNISHFSFPISRRTSDITLFPELHISGNISEDITVLPNHHLIIDDDTVFIPNTSSLTIHPGAVIRINPGVDLTIHGNLLAQGEENNMFWITSNHGFEVRGEERSEKGKDTSHFPFPISRNSIELYNSMELSSIASVSVDLITWGKWDYATTCLLNKVNNLHIQNGIFRNGVCGFKSTGVDSTFCEKLLVEKCIGESEGGIYFFFTTEGSIKRNIFHNNKAGLKIKDMSNPEICENAIVFNEYGMELFASNSFIHNNSFENNSYGLRISGISSPNITLNNISSDISILIGYNGYYPNATPIIYNNNLKCYEYYYLILNHNALDISAQHNYYYTQNIEEIDLKIYDKDNYPPEQQYNIGTIIYLPILDSFDQNAGINN